METGDRGYFHPTYLEFLEFTAQEFKKFGKMPVITTEEIENTDVDELFISLLEDGLCREEE